ncbi:hypothetical protein JRO89_XS11G0161300 [Xanthoceras sorbifolium]|uniref:Cytochrome P450 n=1 Tax=Xanthoceras sorbifolium TaxID=99658 RepID=A0ABQ8HFT0_9ROSI|nr:hypothetical protein JRO89_XS11G0161300 [Xanthoceras sorbifolium]
MFLTVLNVIMSMSWGGSLHREDRNKVGIQLRQIAEEFVDLWGAPNISDLFPMLARWRREQEGRERKQGLSGDLVGVDAEKDDKSSLFMNQVKALLLAIQRDPETWESPLEFQPERFQRDDDGKGEYKGNNFNFLPFGLGRRMC